ncbi:NAD(P)/FAD-dependent oxidoreductase [Kitasatospora sp. NPDC049258]|uniref:FAD-dependent oxidoreductase n=1 Tax=Kitasatospora sp. NPDC049258 TaxID=3155394 RepID=UPI00341E7A11
MPTATTATPRTAAPRIAVVGAGPGGLTCARVLQRYGLPVTVFDRDGSPDARTQGGTLDMQADSGQAALRAAGLLERFLELSRPEGQQMRLLGRDAALLFDLVPEPEEAYKPEIDRGLLRGLLLDSLAPGTVHWGHHLTAVVPLGDGTHRLCFANGATSTADLVIGADGAWSRVRALLSDAVPAYTGVTFVEAWLDDADTRHPELSALVGEGTMMALADSKGLLAQRNGNRRIRLHIGLRADRSRFEHLDLADARAVRAALVREFAGWDPVLLRLITDNDGRFVDRPLFALPVPHTWTTTPGVTLLGDAAHLMSPFSGMGANLAMLDAADLAGRIATEDTLDTAVRAYEATMLPRAAEAAEGAAEGLAGAFSPDSTAHTLQHLAAFAEALRPGEAGVAAR